MRGVQRASAMKRVVGRLLGRLLYAAWSTWVDDVQTARQQLYNSQLLNVLSYDEQYIYVLDPESEQTHTLTHEFVKTSCRSAHAYTIASCQGRQYTGTIALWDTKHAKYSKRHAYTALSRSRSYAALSIED